ncbi:MAG TPA: biopolymer transporter ExbD [Hydrogenophaga sp.]|uniref:ExbD/TolR family protein n=1 Tax=Hydrogenophaga sp. TaxID=1904254 RepID=UPI0008D3D787|nr:biopolymer transporter ExbD [Hydrogenophaga sp.]OGA74266.1 MAG: biopolymer transporter ExbD [Burkholderiales bacterium GWE1_65_30]OGA89621.1 MAG: biopolymer transporter ExbD [Burkholderiales bacterium GWF1_66_17]HAX22740.1 biopolymer transporter ExbD [Hydrogenophaga sp.]HBU18280.1 biopolymer transporter ExbD [Hydrogenophaga sp.]
MSFGRLEKPAGHQPMSDINVTPLVDVMLVLLVIFIITAPLMASRLELELPQTTSPAAGAASEPEAFVSLSVDAKGQIFWDEQPVDNEALFLRLQQTSRINPATELQLRADTAVPYGRVVQLISLSQAAGLSRIGFVADPATGGAQSPAR